MLKLYAFGTLIAAFLISGCATMGGGRKDAEISGLRNQLSVVNAQLQQKEEEVSALQSEIDRMQEDAAFASKQEPVAAEDREVKSRPTVKQIQRALKNAGYNPGSVDGKFGKQTRMAVKSFQKDNNLKADGKVGKKTWRLLKKHL